jgi:uncharacterized membrane protein YeaQ/YmgE (transglycosylase-associated protein family)
MYFKQPAGHFSPAIVTCILIGAAIGFVARFFYPGPKKPRGFFLTTLLGILGAVLASLFGHAFGYVERNQLADPISMVIGALILLFIWNRLVAYGLIRDIA